ncbi:hypothetical protein CEXT_397411 [Caerostris extrusa]|uniref:Uncharacterized protein n=1 Tax=Caerostris extrusa TaxID=172846 RepID=A0AAV4Q1H8_CAEEX|nr:hypothetical protein CEXT_397411 [Caerostris extrusa]
MFTPLISPPSPVEQTAIISIWALCVLVDSGKSNEAAVQFEYTGQWELKICLGATEPYTPLPPSNMHITRCRLTALRLTGGLRPQFFRQWRPLLSKDGKLIHQTSRWGRRVWGWWGKKSEEKNEDRDGTNELIVEESRGLDREDTDGNGDGEGMRRDESISALGVTDISTLRPGYVAVGKGGQPLIYERGYGLYPPTLNCQRSWYLTRQLQGRIGSNERDMVRIHLHFVRELRSRATLFSFTPSPSRIVASDIITETS